MKQEELTALAVQRMKEVFPKEEQFESTYARQDEQVLCKADKEYIYFSAPIYFKDGFVDARMINRLQNGARMLSVGVGEGHLERLLHLGFDIPQRNISVTDYPMIHPRIKGIGFPEYVFDMTKKWPKFRDKFNYVLFPESLNIATMDFEKGDVTPRFSNITKRITDLASQGKLDEIPNSDRNFFVDLLEQDVPVVKILYEILNRALRILKPQGEIRISSGIRAPQQKTYMQLRLKIDGINVSYPDVRYDKYFFLRIG